MNHPGFGRPISYISPKTQDTHTDTRTNAGRNSTCVLAQHIADMEIISRTYHFIVMGSGIHLLTVQNLKVDPTCDTLASNTR